MEPDFRQRSENRQNMKTPRQEFVDGISPSMRSLVSVILEVAQSEVPVLLLAEKGAGKKATARRIHELSRRAGQSFTIVSCQAEGSWKFEYGAGPDSLVGQGTVFLEELSNLSAEGQMRLLQTLTGKSSNGGRGARLI